MKKCSVGANDAKTCLEILSEKQKNGTKIVVQSRCTQHEQPNTAQYDNRCAWCLFSESLAHTIFLLAVLSHN